MERIPFISHHILKNTFQNEDKHRVDTLSDIKILQYKHSRNSIYYQRQREMIQAHVFPPSHGGAVHQGDFFVASYHAHVTQSFN